MVLPSINLTRDLGAMLTRSMSMHLFRRFAFSLAPRFTSRFFVSLFECRLTLLLLFRLHCRFFSQTFDRGCFFQHHHLGRLKRQRTQLSRSQLRHEDLGSPVDVDDARFSETSTLPTNCSSLTSRFLPKNQKATVIRYDSTFGSEKSTLQFSCRRRQVKRKRTSDNCLGSF